jgi:hypothetical protein
MIDEIRLPNGSEILVFGGVKGLISEGERLEKELQAFRPELILVSIPEESIEALEKFMDDPYEITLSDYELIYGTVLSEYGEVMVPPPIYMEPIKYARHFTVGIHGIDMEEEEYSQVYTENVHAFDLVRHSVRKRLIMRHSFKSETPEDFVEEWNLLINKVKGLSRVDEERLVSIEKNAVAYITENNEKKRIAIVLDYEFYKSFVAYMKEHFSADQPPEALE